MGKRKKQIRRIYRALVEESDVALFLEDEQVWALATALWLADVRYEKKPQD